MEPDISPLAKRLAEENNVTWQTLSGSGLGGRIIEKDVLDHLYRVMSGEADLNPTAEPVPDGIEAWPEEDVAGYYRQSATVSAAASVTQDAPEDDFLLDMDAGDGGIDRVDLGAPVGVESGAEVGAGFIGDVNDTFGGGFGSGFGGGFEPLARTPGAEMSDISEDIFLFDDGEEPRMSQETGFADTFSVSELASDPREAEPDFRLEFEDDALEIGAWDSTEALEPEVLLEQDAAEPALDEAGGTVAEAHQAEPVDADLFASDASAADSGIFSSDDVPLFADAPDGETMTGSLVAGSFGTEPMSDLGPHMDDLERDSLLGELGQAVTLEEPELASLGAVASLPPSQLPLVSYGVLLRRHVDLKQLIGAQTALGHELGAGAEISLGLLLARAAAKAFQQAPLGEDRGVGVAHLSEAGVRVSLLPEAASAPLRDLLQIPPDAETSSDCGLVVADLSDYGVDEAVLNLGMPVLSLGRILYDSELGGHHSTLALSGEVGTLRGSRFLALVAELLASPVRLVV